MRKDANRAGPDAARRFHCTWENGVVSAREAHEPHHEDRECSHERCPVALARFGVLIWQHSRRETLRLALLPPCLLQALGKNTRAWVRISSVPFGAKATGWTALPLVKRCRFIGSHVAMRDAVAIPRFVTYRAIHIFSHRSIPFLFNVLRGPLRAFHAYETRSVLMRFLRTQPARYKVFFSEARVSLTQESNTGWEAMSYRWFCFSIQVMPQRAHGPSSFPISQRSTIR